MLEAASKANSSPHTRARLVWCGVAALTCFGVIAVLVAGPAPASDTDGNDFRIETLPESSAVDRTAVDSNTLLTDVSRFHPADGVSSDFTTVVPVAMELGLERLRMAAKPWWTEPDDSPLFRPSKFEFSHKGGPNAAITPVCACVSSYGHAKGGCARVTILAAWWLYCIQPVFLVLGARGFCL